MKAPTRLIATPTFRLAVATVALSLLAAALVVAAILWRTNDLLTRQSLAAIETEAAGLIGMAQVEGPARLATLIGERGRQPGSGLYLLLDAGGRRLAGNLRERPGEAGVPFNGGTFRYRREADSTGGHRLAVALPYRTPAGHTLIVGRDIEELRRLVGDVRRLFFWGFLSIALLGLAGGWWVSRGLLRRIEAVTAASRSIMGGDLSRRIEVDGSADEINRLALSLNAMLERIEELMNAMREVSDNIAHDLKTPLTRLRNRAEAALRDPRGAAAWREGLERTIEEADELIKTFNALLSIARLEAGVPRDGLESLDLAAVARDVAELYEPAAEEAGLVLETAAAGPVPVRANRQLIGQAIANLIDNAIKYGAPEQRFPAQTAPFPLVGEGRGGGSHAYGPRPSGFTPTPGPSPQGGGEKWDHGRGEQPRHAITLRVHRNGGNAELSVADCGPGIPAADREKVLKRFVRLEKSRSQPGSGLGLSLVAAVARLHGGSVRLEDNAPGLRVVVTLPADRASETGGPAARSNPGVPAHAEPAGRRDAA